jgi:hypothetical protein
MKGPNGRYLRGRAASSAQATGAVDARPRLGNGTYIGVSRCTDACAERRAGSDGPLRVDYALGVPMSWLRSRTATGRPPLTSAQCNAAPPSSRTACGHKPKPSAAAPATTQTSEKTRDTQRSAFSKPCLQKLYVTIANDARA